MKVNDFVQSGDPSASVLRKEFWNMLLLVVLYMIQGVPLGLTMGAMYIPPATSEILVTL